MAMTRFLVIFLMFLTLLPAGYTQTPHKEEMVVVTYYPVPYGDYNEMRLKRLAVGDAYFSAADVCWDGTCTTHVAPDVDVVIQEKVGIGTTAPDQALTVEQNAHIKGFLVVNGNVQVDGKVIADGFKSASYLRIYKK
jgi:hypothetical protein